MAAMHGPASAIGSFSTDETAHRSTIHLEMNRRAARRSPDGRLALRTAPEARSTTGCGKKPKNHGYCERLLDFRTSMVRPIRRWQWTGESGFRTIDLEHGDGNGRRGSRGG
jgi:hypothetical protein